MAENYTPNPVSTFVNDTTAVNTVNGNFTAISTALQDVLSLSGVSPNQMKSNLDMNNNQILNLPPPATNNSPVRLVDVTGNPNLSIPATGTSGAVVGFLNGNNTYSGTSTFSGPVIVSNTLSLPTGIITGTEIANTTITAGNIANATLTTTQIASGTVTGSNIASGTITGTNIGSNTVTGSNIASGTVTNSNLAANTVTNASIRTSAGLSVIGNTGTATANVADITGTTRQVLAVNTAGSGLIFAQPQGDQLKGTITNDNATAGNVGEYVSSTVVTGSAISLTNNTSTNITSISLTAGDWDVGCTSYFNFTNTTTWGGLLVALSQVSGSTSVSPGFYSQVSLTNQTPGFASTYSLSVPFIRFSLSSTTTIFMVVLPSFTASIMTGFGYLQARRVR